MIEPLKKILSIYKHKKEELLYYLDDDISNIVKEYDLLDDDNELLLNDMIYCIKRSTLELKHTGKIISVSKKEVVIKEKYKYSLYLPISEYYIFIKRRISKQNEKDFYKALLSALD